MNAVVSHMEMWHCPGTLAKDQDFEGSNHPSSSEPSARASDGGPLPTDWTSLAQNLCLRRIGRGPEEVTFLHGLGGSGRQFEAAANHFDPSKYTLTWIDLPGFGRSPRPETFSYDLSEVSQCVARALADVTARPQHLVAHSMGAIVALRLATSGAVRCASVILAEGILCEQDAVMSERIARRSEAEFVENYPRWLKRVSRLMDEPPATTTDASELAAAFREASPIAMHRAACSCLAHCRSGSLQAEFASLRCPRAYVLGGLSGQGRRDLVMEGAERYVIPNQGHYLMGAGAPFYAPLERFIARNPSNEPPA